MTPAGTARGAIAAVALAVVILITARAHYSTDMSAFLPRRASTAQDLLVQQLENGPLSRLLLIALEGGTPADRARVSGRMAGALRAGPFSSVENGGADRAEADRRFLFDNRYVLSPAVDARRFSVEGLAGATADSLDALSSPAGALLVDLLPADPTGEMLHIIDQLQRADQPRRLNGVWASPDGQRALLLAHTRASGTDTDAQAAAIEAVRQAFAATRPGPLRLTVSGPGVFAVEARAGIVDAARRLSLISAGVILLFLYAVYRSIGAVLLGFVPVVCGALTGIAAVAVGFGTVHGITLGFGATLIGEAVDYSIYLFVQSRTATRTATRTAIEPASTADWCRRHWPTVRLGMFTSIIGFASLLPSAFPGLAQLGLYSIAGLLCAGLVTRFVLADLPPARIRIRDLAPLGRWLAERLPSSRIGAPLAAVILTAAGAVLFLHRGAIWNRDLSALSPVPLAAQRVDERLRADLGAAEGGTLVAIRRASPEATLEAAERAGAVLDTLREQGVIGGYDSPARFLPSQTTQRARRAALPPEPELRARMREALSGLPLQASRLEPFFSATTVARKAPPLSPADLAGTSFAAGFSSLFADGPQPTALLPLHAPSSSALDVSAVRAAFARQPVPGAHVLNFKQESDALYGNYLNEAMRLSSIGLGVICALLALVLREVKGFLQVLAPLLLAVAVVAAGLVLAGQQLTILHLIGMVLVVAIGSNYALFFLRMNDHATLASLLVANTTTVVAFGLLASARVPVLSSLGMTVAPGALLALLFSALLSRRVLAA